MRILLVEDDDLKAGNIAALLGEVIPAAEVVVRRSFRDGLLEAEAGNWWLILLDISLPSYDPSDTGSGNRMRPYAGMEYMHQLHFRGITTPVIVITQFDVFGTGDDRKTLDELRVELRSEFGSQYCGTIYYAPSESAWRVELSKLLEESGQQ